MTRERVVLVVSAVLGVLCLSLANKFVPGVERFIEGLGEALIIAVFLAVTVDVFVKDRLTREIVKEVSPFIMGSHLPSEMRNELYELVKLAVFRSEHELFYELVPDMVSPDFVWVRTKSRFRINNATDHPEPYTHTVVLAELDRPGQLIAAGARGILDESGKQADYEIHEAEMENSSKFEKQWKRVVYIPSHAEGEGASFFWAETLQRLDSKGEITHYSLSATIGLRVVVSYPPEMVVNVTFGHRLHRHVYRFPLDRPTTWELPAAFLPMSALSIEWKKSPPQETLSLETKANEEIC